MANFNIPQPASHSGAHRTNPPYTPQTPSQYIPQQREYQMTPRKLFRIGEVMRYSGLSRQTVHNYTLLGLIRETARTAGGHRLYSEDVFGRLERIKELKKTRTLREIRRLLDREEQG